jgi:hypothetical protein
MEHLTSKKLPNYFKTRIGNAEYELETDTLLTSMAHQFISRSNNQTNIDNYDVIFSISKSEIEEYLLLNYEDSNFVDLFGNWIEDFKTYHSAKNEPLCRDLIFNFSDKSKWCIKIIDLLSLRNEDGDDTINFDDEILKNDVLLMDWVKTLTWDDVKDLAEEIERPQPEPDYENEWSVVEKSINKWDETINILDFFELDDTIEYVEEDDDKSL